MTDLPAADKSVDKINMNRGLYMSIVQLMNPSFKDDLDKEFRYLRWLEETALKILSAAPPDNLQLHRRKSGITFCLEEIRQNNRIRPVVDTEASLKAKAIRNVRYLKKTDPILTTYVKAYCAKNRLAWCGNALHS